MTAAEIIDRYGARLLSFGDSFIIAFSNPSVRYSVPGLCSRQEEIVQELLNRGAEPEVIPLPALKETTAASAQQHSFRVLFRNRSDANQLEIKTVIAPTTLQAWNMAQLIASEENLSLCQVIRSD